MSQLLNDKLLDFKSIIVKSEPVDYHSDDNENGENAIINTTEIVLNNVDVVKRELHLDEENDYEAFDVNTTEPEDSADDQEYELNVEINEKKEDPGKNTIGNFVIFLVKSKLETTQQDITALFLTIFQSCLIINFDDFVQF